MSGSCKKVNKQLIKCNQKSLVMGRTPFYQTSNELEHHFLNIERTQACSSIRDRTQSPFFWLQTIKHRTL